MTVSIIQGDARHLPLADNTVDLVVTSPPYFALRSYQDGGEHYSGQIGSEPTPAEFVAALLDVTRECVRVLKPSGSLWVNLGDKYAGSGPGDTEFAGQGARNGNRRSRPSSVRGVRAKSLIGIPWRYALACIDDLGLILRAEVIWSKPNGLPESVQDRVRRSHEQWFHFVLEPRYYSAVDEIREAHSPNQPWGKVRKSDVRAADGSGSSGSTNRAGVAYRDQLNPLGKLPGSVWVVPTEPLIVPAELGIDHFAAFPTEWPRRIIQGWSPAGVCVECGEGRRPVSLAALPPLDLAWRERQGHERDGTNGLGPSSLGTPALLRSRTITGYACACPEPTAPTTPGIVLDPFGGTGTTALVADVLGRHGISVDMSADYCRLARWRTTDPGQRAKAARVEKPPVEAVGQMGFDFDVETVPSQRMSGGLAMANAAGRNCLGCGYRTQRPSGCEKCGGREMEGTA